MIPILFVIPAFPTAFLLPAFIALAVVAVLFAVRQMRQPGGAPAAVVAESAPNHETATATTTGMDALFSPFMMAAVAGFLLFLWSRHAITVHSYGFFLVLGFSAGVWNAYHEARRRGYDPEIMIDIALPMLLVTVIMCRVLYVVLDWGQFRNPLDIVKIWDGGLSFHGILPGSLMVLAYFAHTRKIGLATLGDIMAPSVFLGYFFGRLGCFFNGCCYGAPCQLPWAVRFHDEHNRLLMTPPSHPTQLYSALLGLLLFFFMQRAKTMPRFTRFPGSLMLLFWALYAVERAFIEIFRNGTTASTVLGTTWLTQAQFVSAVGLVIIALLWVVLDRRAQRRAVQGSNPTAVPA